MLEYCNQLQKLDVSKFDTINIKDIRYMFYECKYLEFFQEID